MKPRPTLTRRPAAKGGAILLRFPAQPDRWFRPQRIVREANLPAGDWREIGRTRTAAASALRAAFASTLGAPGVASSRALDAALRAGELVVYLVVLKCGTVIYAWMRPPEAAT